MAMYGPRKPSTTIRSSVPISPFLLKISSLSIEAFVDDRIFGQGADNHLPTLGRIRRWTTMRPRRWPSRRGFKTELAAVAVSDNTFYGFSRMTQYGLRVE